MPELKILGVHLNFSLLLTQIHHFCGTFRHLGSWQPITLWKRLAWQVFFFFFLTFSFCVSWMYKWVLNNLIVSKWWRLFGCTFPSTYYERLYRSSTLLFFFPLSRCDTLSLPPTLPPLYLSLWWWFYQGTCWNQTLIRGLTFIRCPILLSNWAGGTALSKTSRLVSFLPLLQGHSRPVVGSALLPLGSVVGLGCLCASACRNAWNHKNKTNLKYVPLEFSHSC